MNAVLGRIAWPADPEAACRHYLGFAIQVVESLGLAFPPPLPDPIATAQSYIAGRLSEPDYRAEMVKWWDYIDTVGGVREFQRREALIARLALCLFSFPDEAPELDGLLPWLFVVLFKLGIDATVAESLRLTYFEYR